MSGWTLSHVLHIKHFRIVTRSLPFFGAPRPKPAELSHPLPL